MQHRLNDLGMPKDLALHRIDVAKEDLSRYRLDKASSVSKCQKTLLKSLYLY